MPRANPLQAAASSDPSPPLFSFISKICEGSHIESHRDSLHLPRFQLALCEDEQSPQSPSPLVLRSKPVEPRDVPTRGHTRQRLRQVQERFCTAKLGEDS